MQSSSLILRLLGRPRSLVNIRCQSTSLDLEKLEKEDTTNLDEMDEEAKQREEEIQRKRNKSRLNIEHQNILHDKRPYQENKHWSHDTLRYHRRMFGRLGNESKVDPSLCWPTKEELGRKLEYEQVAYPYTIPEMMEMARAVREEKELKVQKKMEDIEKKMEKLEGWKNELKAKIAKREAEARAARERRERLLEEVRLHFGYKVDPRDEKFKEMVEKKEKAEKKLKKEARKKAKDEKALSQVSEPKPEVEAKEKEEKEKE